MLFYLKWYTGLSCLSIEPQKPAPDQKDYPLAPTFHLECDEPDFSIISLRVEAISAPDLYLLVLIFILFEPIKS